MIKANLVFIMPNLCAWFELQAGTLNCVYLATTILEYFNAKKHRTLLINTKLVLQSLTKS